MHCDKLPALITIGGKDFSTYLQELYPIYHKSLTNGDIMFNGKKVDVITDLNSNLQHQSFEHLTTKGSQDRLYNLKRCERMLWIRHILTECNGCADFRFFPDISWKPKKNNKRYYLWCVKSEYLIILEDRQGKYLLITAYCILYKSKRDELQRKYDGYIKQKRRP